MTSLEDCAANVEDIPSLKGADFTEDGIAIHILDVISKNDSYYTIEFGYRAQTPIHGYRELNVTSDTDPRGALKEVYEFADQLINT